jgi:hypothetical protein
MKHNGSLMAQMIPMSTKVVPAPPPKKIYLGKLRSIHCPKCGATLEVSKSCNPCKCADCRSLIYPCDICKWEDMRCGSGDCHRWDGDYYEEATSVHG